MPQPNQLPFVPNNPVPPDDAYDVQTTPTLSWSGGDPDSGDSVTYDVYFGTNYDPVKVVSNQSETSYSPGLLSYKTQYYWRIVAWDNHGAHSDGDIWSFITIIKANNLPPNIPEDPYPANESGLISVFNYLSWTSGDPNPEDYLSFDVYFGPINPPQKVSANQTAHSYSLPPLTYDTTYYWRIVAWDDMGTSTQGPLWSFTTVPETSSLKVKISRPEGGGSIYFRDQQLVAKTKAYAPLIIGKLTVQAEIVESTFAIQKVDFFIDGARRGTDTKAPYEFLWTEHVSFGHTIEIVVTDVMNNKAFSEITVRKLI